MSETDDLDITGLDHAELLFELVNGTRPPGGPSNPAFLDALLSGTFTMERARHYVERAEPWNGFKRFDYVDGRPIKVSLSDTRLSRPDLYDRDCPGGPGSCALIVAILKERAAAPKKNGPTVIVADLIRDATPLAALLQSTIVAYASDNGGSIPGLTGLAAIRLARNFGLQRSGFHMPDAKSLEDAIDRFNGIS